MRNKYSLSATTAIVIANMIGTGIFVSLGFQLLITNDFATIIILWVVGGLISLCGAFVYSEIGSALPKSGGEYHYLSKLYHPSIGFVSGWLSSTIGFAAPIALSGITFGTYIHNVVPSLSENLLAILIILIVTLFNSINHFISGSFQLIFTIFKVVLILFFIVFGLLYPPLEYISFSPTESTLSDTFSTGFAINLVYVSFAFSGWNASAYIASEVENPRRNLPLSIIFGTSAVIGLYVLLNAVFLMSAPVNELMVDPTSMMPKEIGFVAAENMFNTNVANVISIIIGVFLISSISSMVITGPRVLQTMINDYPVIKKLRFNENKIPVFAILLQSAIAILILLSGSFDSILTYTTFALTIFSILTVIGVFILRKKNKDYNDENTYRTWGYPITPVVFILANTWFLTYLFVEKPKDALIALGLIIIGFLLYIVIRKKIKSNPN